MKKGKDGETMVVSKLKYYVEKQDENEEEFFMLYLSFICCSLKGPKNDTLKISTNVSHTIFALARCFNTYYT